MKKTKETDQYQRQKPRKKHYSHIKLGQNLEFLENSRCCIILNEINSKPKNLRKRLINSMNF